MVDNVAPKQTLGKRPSMEDVMSRDVLKIMSDSKVNFKATTC